MKKLFALLAVAALAAVGCDDKKSTAKPENKTGGTYLQTVKTDTTVHTDVTHTKVIGVETATHTDTKVHTVTTTKPGDKGPGLPDGKGKGEGK